MNAVFRLAAFGLVLALVFAGAAAVGSAVGPLERGQADTGHEAAARTAPDGPDGLEVAAHGLRLVAPQTRFAPRKRQPFEFQIVDRRGLPLRAYDIAHARRMHLVVVRRDLTGFQHLHPTQGSDGTWKVQLGALAPGSHRAFADFTTGGEQRVLGVDLFVSGRAPLRRIPAPIRVALAGEQLAVFLDTPSPPAGEPVTLRFRVRQVGAPARLESFLGALGHLVVLREGDLGYLHVHADRDELAFETTFPSPGRYRAFLQFATGGRKYLVPFTVEAS